MPTPKRVPIGSRTSKIKATRGAAARSRVSWWHREKKLSGLRLCGRCDAVWYDGHWHTAPDLAEAIKKGLRKAGSPDTCEECRYALHGPGGATAFEGQLTLDGVSDPSVKSEVLAAVRAFGRRAVKRDPMDRILSIDDRGDRVVVFTSENQLAAGLGRAIDSAFKGSTLRITWSESDLPARVHWTYGKKAK